MNGENQTGKSAPATGSQPAGQWQYTGGTAPFQPTPTAHDHDGQSAANLTGAAEFEWSGSEFIAHSKSPAWYAAFTGVALGIAVLGYLLTKDWIATLLMVAAAVILGISANRQPRTLTYRITPSGIDVGRRFYPFNAYKAFSVMDEGAFSSITFWPLKRFGIPLSLYYDPKDEEVIAGILADHLPMQPHTMDAIERLMHSIRF